MPLRDLSQLPDRVLKAFAQAFDTLRVTNRPRLPVGIGQHEVIQQVREALVLDANRQVRHIYEIGGTQPPRMVPLRKKHLLGRPIRRPPYFDPTLQSASLSILKAAGILPLYI